jgi:SAM-dependent methyltransferase
MREHRADELRGLDEVRDQLPEASETVELIVGRVRPHFDLLRPGARVLEIGAAQGMTVLALKQAGYDARGIEPWRPAVETSRELARETGMPIDVVEGMGENLPFGEEEFDFVLAVSVMEHVRDPLAVFREVHRVLRPGGGFFFHTTTALARKQEEIKWFPLFAWYPAPLKRRILTWAAANRPTWVGGTATPAYNWFTPWGVRRDLAAIGFAPVLERWDLVRVEELEGWRRTALRIVRSNRAFRFLGEFMNPGSGYLAVKPDRPHG